MQQSIASKHMIPFHLLVSCWHLQHLQLLKIQKCRSLQYLQRQRTQKCCYCTVCLQYLPIYSIAAAENTEMMLFTVFEAFENAEMLLFSVFQEKNCFLQYLQPLKSAAMLLFTVFPASENAPHTVFAAFDNAEMLPYVVFLQPLKTQKCCYLQYLPSQAEPLRFKKRARATP